MESSANNDSPRKEASRFFLNLVSSGNVREAYEKYVAPDFRHHNPYFPANAQALEKGMDENTKKFTEKAFEIKRILEDEDLVAVHSRVRPKTVGSRYCGWSYIAFCSRPHR